MLCAHECDRRTDGQRRLINNAFAKCDVRRPAGLCLSYLVAMGFLRKFARYWPMELAGSDLSAAFEKIFDIRLEEVQFWGRTLIG